MKKFLHRIGKTIGREIRILFWILTAGGSMVVVSMALLAVNHAWEDPAHTLAGAGLKVLFFGYPVYLLFRALKKIYFSKK